MIATYGESQKCDITLAQGENFPVEILALFDNSKDKRKENIGSGRAFLLGDGDGFNSAQINHNLTLSPLGGGTAS